MNRQNPFIYRLSQLISLLLGARIFVLIFLTFTLYVSAFFLFSQEESLRKVVFDIKIHGIIFCSALSIAAGGIINRFYDKEKDRLQRPFRTRLQSFLREKYFLYSYIIFTALALFISLLLSLRIFAFFLLYQFLIWLYSHKLSRIVVQNNLFFVGLSLYPFFGLLVYCRHFSTRLFLMATFLFCLLLIIDLLKDILTLKTDILFSYNTLPSKFGTRFTVTAVQLLLFLLCIACVFIIIREAQITYLVVYYFLSILVAAAGFVALFFKKRKNIFFIMNFLRVWIFVGVIFMLLNGIMEKL